MVGSPGPGSPTPRDHPPRPMSAMMRPARSSSRMSMSSRTGGSRASDDDSRTSVKVAVRVRPPLKPTDPGFELIPQRFQKGMVHVTSPTSIAVDSPQGRKIFVFDRVFSPDTTQDGVWEYLEESVSAFLQGFNVSLLAYGQSGAGKSFTMGTSGPVDQDSHKIMGVIPRAAISLFEKLQGSTPDRESGIKSPVRYSTPIATLQRNNPDKGWTMKATYVEIYNETLRDLLLPEGTRPEDRAPITIREDTKGRIMLTGLRQVEINSVQDLLGVLNFGSSIRQTDATAVNAKSSRSHAVFTLNLVQRKVKGTEEKGSKRFSMPVEPGSDSFLTVDSKMHFVDLAGSERLKNTHAQGERAKEGISINGGLASLGKVISQLSSRQSGSHVSYRDSKLTRLLQDSLGGNSITYMVACVTPAEFHLSETLNTIQYAQRARAIQSKPRIQQVSDDGDMKQLVDRLRAEIQFLREQLKNHTEQSERSPKEDKSKTRTNERELELQNQLLDIQENYTALSQRHAKLISEMTKARDAEQAPHAMQDYTDTAIERLKRSNSFAEAVEQVVLEYEKTIQSLESSLTSTRSSLSNSESTLLEKESRLAYVETMNQQLQTRLQKMIDRENSTESYLHDLEAKLMGHTSGEEKSSAIIAELKKEIARVRENESGCEDYISTLEERLAESEQDMELMQREITRLEHVIDRQRSLGKLDNLLLELDSIKEKEEAQKMDTRPDSMDSGCASSDGARDEALLAVRSPTPHGTPPIMESPAEDDENCISTGNSEDVYKYMPPSPAQSQFVHDKLETVQQELCDLRVEHEQTVTEYSQLASEYQSALRKLAKMQDQIDELKHAKIPTPECTSRGTSPPESPVMRPASFLADARVNDLKVSEEQSSSSRSLSSELSLAGESPSSTPMDIDETAGLRIQLETESERASRKAGTATPDDLTLLKKVEDLLKEKEEIERNAEKEQERLRKQLSTARDELAELKTIGSTYTSLSRGNGRSSPPSQFLRRKSSQSLAVVDRAQRAFTNLRRIANEHLSETPEILENFELNLDGAIRELQARSDRIHDIESECSALRREMESKTAMISGLTRERTSIQSSPMDISVVAVMQRRIDETESQLYKARKALEEREGELLSARKSLEAFSGDSQSEAITLLDELTKERKLTADQARKIAELTKEVDLIKSGQIEALRTLQDSKVHLERTVKDMEDELARAKETALQHEQNIRHTFDRQVNDYQDRIDSLQKTISDNRQTIELQMQRVAELENSHSAARRSIEIEVANGASSADVQKYKDAVSQLEATLEENKKLIQSQQIRLDALEQSYEVAVTQLDNLKAERAATLAALKRAESRAAEEIAAATAAHEEILVNIRAELAESQGAVNTHATDLAKVQAEYASLQEKYEAIQANLKASPNGSSEDTAALKAQLAEHQETIEAHVATLKEMQEVQDAREAELQKLMEKEKKHTNLINSLEQELTFAFDQGQEATNNLAALTKDYEAVVAEREELTASAEEKAAESQKIIEGLQEEIAKLKAKLAEVEQELQNLGARAQRSNSTSSNSNSNNVRKSNSSVVTLPSPPPAIPLPPLPASSSPPPGAGPTRRPSKDYVSAHMEDQEARIKTLEKQLQAEKALTATLEEALTDCEKTMKRLTSDRDSFQQKASLVEKELEKTKNESASSRYSMQAVEEERLARQKAEQARAQLEERMQALNKKKTRSFACF
ncbi:hypothetical protein BZA77DRAFT_355437 [Pyronema omphalodes]|nr:hypothetical protein BZA77DRAFT_355437 [Pyronema omphalodes]